MGDTATVTRRALAGLSPFELKDWLLAQARLVTGGDERLAEGGVGEAGAGELVAAGAFVVVRAAHVFEVEVGDGVAERVDGMGGVVAGAEQALLFAEVHHEEQGAFGPQVAGGEGFGEGEDGGDAAGVVVGAVMDAVAFAAGRDADVVVVSGEENGFVAQSGVAAGEAGDDVAELERLFAGAANPGA
jgi:hypothetical protein